jgi:glucose-6-phosphate isomerase
MEANFKSLPQRVLPEFETLTEPNLNHNSSTNRLIRRYRELKETL